MMNNNSPAKPPSIGTPSKGLAPPNNFSFSLDTPSFSSGTLDKYLKSVLGEDSATAIPDLLKPQGLDGSRAPITSMSSLSNLNTLHSIGNLDGTPHEDIKPIQSSSSNHTIVHDSPPASPQVPQVELSQDHQHHHQQGQETTMNSENGALATTNENGELIAVPRGQNYVDITEYLNMPQADAAKKLGIPPSTLSKRWKEAVRKRKWPYRMICKIDKEIMTLLHNVPQGPNAPPLPEEIETALGISLRKRQEELRPVVIRI
eukprot:TRINITY_DN4681_c0_g1_i1.p1 TRINITY_DN4681_c0_g1~~TRINITY_DN4681_c0_g1_i1.p1  ORF type:complete len:260 (-),score=69.98 TRINITY_DN4681_c0_g1_i1:36-815(-)